MTVTTCDRSFDILFLHAPAGFNKHRDPLSGVFPAAVGTNDLFLHAPIGIKALYHRLKSRGFSPGFINVGRLYHEAVLQGDKFDLTEFLRGVTARGIGIDLHWAVHTPGALDLAGAVKSVYPETFVFLGGLTSTYFHRELLNDYPFIDAVVLGEGDMAMEPLARALENSNRGGVLKLDGVPNLAYRTGEDIAVNKVLLPETWNETRFHDIPDIEEYGSCMYISIKGCTMNCPFCGGSADSYKKFFHRECTIALPPHEVVREMELCKQKGAEMIYLLGDIRIMGNEYTNTFLRELEKTKIDVRVQQELFFPADDQYLERWKKAVEDCSLIFSPESADIHVRQRMGKHFPDDVLWRMARTGSRLELNFIFSFLYALPGQDIASVRKTMDFIEEVVTLPHVDFVNEPMLYIDPASPIFEEPEKWGYHIDVRTIKDFKEYLERPYWRQSIGYYTDWMSKDELADTVLEVAERSVRIRMNRNPAKAPLYLLTLENRDLNRETLNYLDRQEPPKDEAIREFIGKRFPDYLLKDNLTGKDRMPSDRDIPYSGFSYLIYLLVHIMGIPAVDVAAFLREWFSANPLPETFTMEDFRQFGEVPHEFADFFTRFADGEKIHRFIRHIIEYEWTNRMAVRVDFGGPYIRPVGSVESQNLASSKLQLHEAAVFKTFPYNFTEIEWNRLSADSLPEPNVTDYLYFLPGKSRRAISPSLKELLLQCNGKKPLIDIIFRLKNTPDKDPLSMAMELGAMVSAGILKVAAKTPRQEEK